jgi:hypothetical protein
MDKSKKDFFNSKELWEKTRNLLFEEEETYKTILVDKYEGYIKKVKEEVKSYCNQNNFTIIEKTNFMDAEYNSYSRIRLDFPDPHPIEKYVFKLALIENNRREFFIITKPKVDNLYIPKRSVSIVHPIPRNLYESKQFISNLNDEILSLQEKDKLLRSAKCVFYYYSAKNENPEEKELKPHNNFLQILTSLYKI